MPTSRISGYDSCQLKGAGMHFDAAIFDMDGVITRTAIFHSSAWKKTFDHYLRVREARYREPFRAFTQQDYLAFVDGRPRYAGVDTFLRSRGISLPFGDPADAPDTETVCGVGNRKNECFNQVLDECGVEVYDSTIELIHRLRENGVKVGVATSSRNGSAALQKAGIEALFHTCVDGSVAALAGLKGKPEPDIFLFASARLSLRPSRVMVVEDAASGVEAGAKGHFGLVVGIARENNAAELRRQGADVVVADLAQISLEAIDAWFESGKQIETESVELAIQGAL